MTEPNTLDEQIDKILGYRHIPHPVDMFCAETEERKPYCFKQQLKTLFTEHSNNCNDIAEDQPNDVHIKYFNAGYEKGKAEKCKGAEIRARMKQLRKDRQHEIDVWESDRNAGYYEQELKQLKAQLKRNKGEDNE